MLSYLYQEKKYFYSFIILMPLRALSSVAVTTVIASIVDFAMEGSLDQLPKYFLYFIGYILVDFLINIFDAKIHFNLIQSSISKLKLDLFNKVMHENKNEFNSNSSKYLSIIENDIEIIRETLYTVMDMMEDFLRMFFAIIVVFYYSWQIGIFILITSFLQAFIPIVYGHKLESVGASYTISKEKHITVLKDYLSAFMTAKIFHIEDKLSSNYRKTVHENELKWNIKEFLESFVNSLSFVFNKIAYLGIFLMGGYLMLTGSIRLSIIVAITDVVSYISGPSLYLVDDLSKMKSSQESFRRVKTILGKRKQKVMIQDRDLKLVNIRLSDVSFGYGKKNILDHISYLFEKNKKYLIVGKSGGGKSTLLNLISGLESTYTGHIWFNHIDLKNISKKNIAENICLIEQTPFIFDDTIYNNITLFEEYSEDEVKMVLKDVGLLEYVLELEKGIHTELIENGKNLSGGEKQRLALARALIRKTPFIFLDEYTSNLDMESLEKIEKCIFNLKNTTVIVVSHRAEESFDNYHKVIKIEKNKLVELK